MRTISLLLLCLLAHTLFAQRGVAVVPAFPAYLYQGDRLELGAAITNNTGAELTGQAELQLIDATTGESVDGWFQNVFPNQYLTVGAGATEQVKFPIEVPYLFHQVLGWRLVVHLPQGKNTGQAARLNKSGSMPILLQKSFETVKTILPPGVGSAVNNLLLESEGSESMQHHSLSATVTTDPALLFLPDLVRATCGKEQTTIAVADRFAALALLEHKRWKTGLQHLQVAGTEAGRNLAHANFYLPWVAQQGPAPETLPALLDTLKSRQHAAGTFTAAPGVPGNTASLLGVVQRLAWLQRLEAVPSSMEAAVRTMVAKSVLHLEAMLRHLQKQKTAFKVKGWPELVYTRTLAAPLSGKSEKAWHQLMLQCFEQRQRLSLTEKWWLLLSMGKANIAGHPTLYKELRSDTARQASFAYLLLEYAQGQNLPEAKAHYLPFPVQVQDAFSAACAVAWAYPALNQPLGKTTVQLGNQVATTSPKNGHLFTSTIKGPFVKPDMGRIRVGHDSTAPAWVAVNWHYFTPRMELTDPNIKVTRSLWRKENSATGWQLLPQGSPLRKGDTLEVRISLSRNQLQNVMLSEMQPAAFTPLTDGTGSPLHHTQGAGIHFSFSYLDPKQVTFAYSVVVQHGGSFNAGGTTLRDADTGSLLAHYSAEPLYIE